MIEEAPSDALQPKQVVIPYVPRKHFIGLHRSTKRFKFVVAHRRAGKSVAEINEEIKQALTNTRAYPPPRYAYIGPTFAQTKDLIWEYLKYYTSVLPGVSYSESDLQCTLPNGALINLYGGSSAYERMRGLYFDGVVMDEFSLLNPNVLSTVVRPCLADYRGWAIISGTSNGDDHFHALKKNHSKDPDWDFFVIPVTQTDALHPDEVVEMTKDMSPDEFAREMLCSFAAPVEGAYYGDILNKLEAAQPSRITSVPYDPSCPVFTWWDLGMDDQTVIWFVQRVGRELHIIDYLADSGKGLDFYAQALKAKGYTYALHILPHDVKARELGTGRSRFEVLMELLGDIWPCPIHRVEDGINATRTVLPLCYFDAEKTEEGRTALRNYHRGPSGQPVHNWASHPADAFRVGSVSLNQVVGYIGAANVVSMRGGRLRRRIRGLA
jgi:hypothetical protein